MDLNETLLFTRVVQHGSFTAAARALGMPKSTLSRKVSQLEDRLGVRLLQRTTRRLGLTDSGRIYYEHGLRIVTEAETAERAMSDMHGAPCGKLRVTAPVSFTMLGVVIAEYAERFPAVSTELISTDRMVDLVDEGYDLAIRIGKLADSTLVARPLGSLEHVLVATPGYLARRALPAQPEALAEHALLLFAARRAREQLTLSDLTRTVTLPITARVAVNDFVLLRETALEGLGIASVPSFLCDDDVRAGRLTVVLPGWSDQRQPVHAVYSSARHTSPKVLRFAELLRDRLLPRPA